MSDRKLVLNLLFALLLQIASVAAAAPPNDDLGDRIYLGNVAMVNVIGSNVDATMQKGERTGPAGRRTGSIWYSWTAPASGWVAFNTEGSDFNTILSLGYGGGSSVAHVIEQFTNDGFTGSRILFDVLAGRTYVISVAGREGAEGNVVLNIMPSAEPPIRIESANILPNPVRAGEQAILELEIIFTEAPMQGSAWIQTTPGGGIFRVDYVGEEHLVSGDTMHGVYRIPLWTSPFLPEGPLFISVWCLNDSAGNRLNYFFSDEGASAPVPPPEGLFVNVINDFSPDYDPPMVSALEVTPNPVEFSKGGDVAINITVTDDASGIFYADFGIYDSEGNLVRSSGLELEGWDPINTATEVVTILLPASLPSGTYHIRTTMEDMIGRFEEAGTPENPFPNGISGEFEVINDGDTFPSWALEQGLGKKNSGLQDDPDCDGIVNLLEYAFGMNPLLPDAHPVQPDGFSGLMGIGPETSNGKVPITFVRRRAPLDLFYGLETAKNGQPFNPGGTVTTIRTSDGKFERVTTHIRSFNVPAFARMKVTYVPVK